LKRATDHVSSHRPSRSLVLVIGLSVALVAAIKHALAHRGQTRLPPTANQAIDNTPDEDITSSNEPEPNSYAGSAITHRSRHRAPRTLLAIAIAGLAISILIWRAGTVTPPSAEPTPGSLLVVTSDSRVHTILEFNIDHPFSPEPMMAVGLKLQFPDDLPTVNWAIAISDNLAAATPKCPQDRSNTTIFRSLICINTVNMADVTDAGRATLETSDGPTRSLALSGTTRCCNRTIASDHTIYILVFIPLRQRAAQRSGPYRVLSGPSIQRRVLSQEIAGDATKGQLVMRPLAEPIVGTMTTPDNVTYVGSVTEMPPVGQRRVETTGLQETATSNNSVEFQLTPFAAMTATIINTRSEHRANQWSAAALLAAGLFLALLAQETSYYIHQRNTHPDPRTPIPPGHTNHVT
jgi:hypothetical protein